MNLCVYMYEYMYIFHMALYIRLLGWHISVYTQYALYKMCLYSTVIESLCINTVSSSQQRSGPAFYRWRSSESAPSVFWSKAEPRFSKPWGRYNLPPCCVLGYIRIWIQVEAEHSSFVILLKFLIKLQWSCICHHLGAFVVLCLFSSQLPLSVFW